MKYKYRGISFEVKESDRKDSQKVAIFKDGTKIHFGDPDMKEYPGTSRGDNYCARSYGLGKKYNTLENIKNANTLSRLILWNCKGKKSMKNKQQIGLIKL